MCRANRVLLSGIVVAAIAGGTAAYNFFVGFPRTFEGRRVHRVSKWSPEGHFQPELIYYAYIGADGKEVRHGDFRRFDNGHLVQEATYRHGQVDGPITYWNLFGDKTEEIYYHQGKPYGWAYFANGKLLSMRQEVTQEGRTVAVKTFEHDRYALQFNCGELISISIDPVSGRISPVPDATEHACAQKQPSKN
jgi:hypothetical protein